MSRAPVSTSRMPSVRILRSFLSMAPWLFPFIRSIVSSREIRRRGKTFSPLLELLSQGQAPPCLKGGHGGGLLPVAPATPRPRVRGRLGRRLAEVAPIDHHRRITFAAYSFDEILTGGPCVVPARPAHEVPDDPSRQIEALFEALP